MGSERIKFIAHTVTSVSPRVAETNNSSKVISVAQMMKLTA
jgi:hypothetical protein